MKNVSLLLLYCASIVTSVEVAVGKAAASLSSASSRRRKLKSSKSRPPTNAPTENPPNVPTNVHTNAPTTRTPDYLRWCLEPEKKKYALVIDGGSSKSEGFVYEWTETDEDSPVTELKKFKSNGDVKKFKSKEGGGIGNFNQKCFLSGDGGGSCQDKNGMLIETYLTQLIDELEAFAIAKNIPLDGQTPIYFFATAGMRTVEDSAVRTRMMKDVKMYLDKTEFAVPQRPDLISGQEEATFALLANNYNINNIKDWKGIVEMGGASSQIGFYSDSVIDNAQTMIWRLDETNEPNFEYINFFADSYNPFGANELRGRYYNMVVQDNGDLNGTANCYPNKWKGKYNNEAFKGGDIGNSYGMFGSGLYNKSYEGRSLTGTGNQLSCAVDIDKLLKLDPEDGSNNYAAGGDCLPDCGIKGRHVANLTDFHNDFYILGATLEAAASYAFDIPYGEKPPAKSFRQFNASVFNETGNACTIDWNETLPLPFGRFEVNECITMMFALQYLKSLGFDEFQEKLLFDKTPEIWTLGALVSMRQVEIFACDYLYKMKSEEEISQ